MPQERFWNKSEKSIFHDHFDDLVIFDHHKSTVNNFEGELPFNLIYQVADCGAIMAWKNYLGDKPIPLFLKFICARDTWKWNSVPNFSAEETKIICLGLYEACRPEYLDIEKTKPNFINWFFFLLNDNWLENIIEKGETLKNHQNIVLKDLKKSASLVKFGNHTVCVCNSPIEISDLGNQLAAEEECDYALIWRASGDRIAISLRSIGDFDVSEIAEQYPPGGGHRNAAAFSCPQHLFCLTSNNLFIPTMNQKPQFLQKMAEFYLSRLKQQIEG